MNQEIHHFKSLTSTQDKSKQFAKKGERNIVIIADKQTKARGRFNRKWHSSKGGLWMSFLLKIENVSNLQFLTFSAAIAVVRAIKEIGKINTKIKWPNDVYFKGKKLCGILTEGVFGKENYVIVGVGLNVNQIKFPNSIKKNTTSLKTISNKNFDIKILSQIIVNEFYSLYNKYYLKGKYEKIVELWRKYCDTLNKEVVVKSKTKKIEGEAIDIDKEGNLLIKLKSKKIIKIIEGDIKLSYN